MSRRRILKTAYLMIATLIIMVFTGGNAIGARSWNYNIKLMTGTMGGVWYPTGGAMAEFLQKDIPGLTMTVMPGAGISNIEAMESGRSLIAFGKACTTWQALRGEPPFKQKASKVRNVMYLYDESFHFIVRADSGIEKVEDLKGKVLTTLQKGNTGEQMAADVLKVHGLSYKDMARVHFGSYNDSVELMKDGHADAWMFGTAVPASAVMDLAATRKIKWISLSDEKLKELNHLNEGYVPQVVEPGAYEFQTYPVKTFGTATHLMASADLPADFVYEVTKSLARNLSKLGDVHALYKPLTPALMAKNVGVPFHEGALKYYKEIGVIK
ncbi:MAG TPA: TAXI family TRAP transporter solute-binding subunit [Firmicutes bacterium]|nr:TAXI family TRAP transporter solute-binding subunit [Bacillota bacterium]